jgi:Glutaredoxin-like domain (DUF836)
MVTLYGKPGCCLCDEAREAVEALRTKRGFDLREVDVSLDPRLHRQYGERIPVAVIEAAAGARGFDGDAAGERGGRTREEVSIDAQFPIEEWGHELARLVGGDLPPSFSG